MQIQLYVSVLAVGQGKYFSTTNQGKPFFSIDFTEKPAYNIRGIFMTDQLTIMIPLNWWLMQLM